jgi:hypothetical protein
MLGLFRKTPPRESLPAKFARLLAFHAEMVASTRAAIADLKRQDQPALLISNYSHLVGDHCQIAVMQWRLGQDPRAAIAAMHTAYHEMIACRAAVDPDRRLPMAQIAGITDWDFVHALFWLAAMPEPVQMHFPRLAEERYFACSHFLLHRVTGTDVPGPLAQAVAGFQSGDGLAARDFRDKLALLDGEASDALIARIEGYWRKRRRDGFYQSSAPLLAGFDASNDLSVDWQLACILRVKGIARPHSPHAWHW